MFPRGEAKECPVCGIAVVSVSKLPEPPTDEDGVPTHPEDELLPWTYFGRARGALLVLCGLGLLAFAIPWVHTFTPERHVFTGIDIARRTGITWAAGVAWFTLVPLVLSRRTIRKMRGARLAVAVLAIIPAIAAGVLLANPPGSVEVHGITILRRFAWDPGIFATIAISVIAAALAAARFGGGVDDIRVKTGSSANHSLH